MTSNQRKPMYDGLRVLELADIKGMYCGKMLAQLGAEVIKIECIGGDESRKKGPFAPGEDNKLEKSLSFAYLNTGKRGITLNIDSEEGKAILLKMAETADVVIETLAPGELDGLGLGYETMRQINPGIIMASITPFGQDGPHSGWQASSDLIPDAMGGCMPDIGYLGRSPLHLGYDIMANVCGLYASFAIQAAYHHRLTTQTGTHIDLSQQEAFSMWRSSRLGDAQLARHDFPLRGGEGYVRQGLVNCKDGFAYVMLGIRFKELLAWFKDAGQDISEFDDPKYDIYSVYALALWDEPLLRHLNELGAQYTAVEFMEEGQRRKIPACAMESPDTLLDNKQLQARGYFVEVDHPVIGAFKYPGSVVKLTGAALQTEVPAPLLGADNTKIYTSIGISAADQEALRARGVM